MAEERRLRARRGEGEADAGGGFDDAGSKLQKAQADGGELGSGERMCCGHGVAHCQDQPVSGGVQDQAHLVGQWTAAAGAVGGELGLVQMIDVQLPTTDGRELVLTRYTEPEPELRLLLKKLKLELPAQPPPKITAAPASPIPL